MKKNETESKITSFILFAMRVFLGIVFIYSGWEKLIAPIQNFIAVIQQYQFLPPALVSSTASLMPWLELIFGTFILLGFLTRLSAGTLAFFLTVFIILLLRSVWLHLPISECGCFGSGITLAPHEAILLDTGLLLTSLILIWRQSSLFSLDRKLQR